MTSLFPVNSAGTTRCQRERPVLPPTMPNAASRGPETDIFKAIKFQGENTAENFCDSQADKDF